MGEPKVVLEVEENIGSLDNPSPGEDRRGERVAAVALGYLAHDLAAEFLFIPDHRAVISFNISGVSVGRVSA